MNKTMLLKRHLLGFAAAAAMVAGSLARLHGALTGTEDVRRRRLPYPELLDLLVTDALAGQAPMRAGQ